MRARPDAGLTARRFWPFMTGAIACLALPFAQAATQFTFSLDGPFDTSAGVYDEWGGLVRTLTRGERLQAGTHTLTWDNRDDRGNDMGEYGGYEDENGSFVPYTYRLKLLKHNISHVWEGVIGNTSASFNGLEVYRSFKPPQSLTLAGDHLYFAVGYNEGQMGGHGFRLADPQRNVQPLTWRWDRANGVDPFISLGMVAADGARLYWANTGRGYISTKSFVLVSDLGTRNYGSFSAGHPVCLTYRNAATGQCYEGQNYLSVIDEEPDSAFAPTGLAVQANGPLLAVAHGRQGQVKLFDKVSGELLKTFAIPTNSRPLDDPLNQLAMAPNGDLWVIHDTVVMRYTNLAVEPTLAFKVVGLSKPLAVAVHPGNDDMVLVADGGESQQVKAFTRNGDPLWAYGRLGGYVWNPFVSTDKLGFKLSPAMVDAPISLEQTSLVVQPDGSFWVVDTANSRMLHIGADRVYREQVAYLATTYSATVDPNNPRRVFSTFLEFEVDTTAPLQPGESTSWRLVRNWAAGFPKGPSESTGFRFSGLMTVTTLRNGRTYALAKNANGDGRLVELPQWGPARDTGITLRSACPEAGQGPLCVLYENGDLGYVTGPTLDTARPWLSNNYQRVYRKALSGFNAAGNPQWGAPQLLATVYANPLYAEWRNQPYFHHPYAYSGLGGPRFPITQSNRVVFFDSNVWMGDETNGSHLFRNDGFHLGAVNAGEGMWSWMASPTGWLDGKGSFQTQAVEAPLGLSIQYGGNAVWAQGQHIVYGFHGEFFRDQATGLQGQANQFMHFHEDGLFIAQFGDSNLAIHGPPRGAAPGRAGNAFANILVQAGPNALYWYHNDESNHGGLHRWRIDNLDSAVVLSGPLGVLDSTIGTPP